MIAVGFSAGAAATTSSGYLLFQSCAWAAPARRSGMTTKAVRLWIMAELLVRKKGPPSGDRRAAPLRSGVAQRYGHGLVVEHVIRLDAVEPARFRVGETVRRAVEDHASAGDPDQPLAIGARD